MRRVIAVVAIVICVELVAWNLPTWLADFISLSEHGGAVSGIVSLDQLSMIATASRDGKWRLFSNKGKLIRETPSNQGGLSSIVADEANHRVITSSDDGTLCIWGLPRAVEQRTIEAHPTAIQAISMDANGRQIASVGYDQFLRVWDLETGAKVSEKKLKRAANCLAMHPQTTWVMYSDSENEGILWSIKSKIESKRLSGFKSQPSAACFNPEGTLLAIGEERGGLTIWDTATWNRKYQYFGHTERINQIVFSKDSATFWTASSDKTIRRWNQTDGSSVGVLDRHRGPALCIDESLDGKLLSGGAWKNAVIWLRPDNLSH